MGHRFGVVLFIICFALGATGCAWQFQTTNRKEAVVMPLQTGSTLHRRVIVPTNSAEVTKKEKKESKKKEDSERKSPTPTPAPARKKQPKPEEDSSPDRFR